MKWLLVVCVLASGACATSRTWQEEVCSPPPDAGPSAPSTCLDRTQFTPQWYADGCKKLDSVDEGPRVVDAGVEQTRDGAVGQTLCCYLVTASPYGCGL